MYKTVNKKLKHFFLKLNKLLVTEMRLLLTISEFNMNFENCFMFVVSFLQPVGGAVCVYLGLYLG